jgi:hypothetical protein
VNASGQLTIFDHGSAYGGTAVALAVVVAFLAFCLAAVGYQVSCWRRSSGDQRQQLKWFASGAAVTFACVTLSAGLPFGNAVSDVLILGSSAAAVAMGIGILRYRLYEIDRIISRTLAYAIVTGLLVGLYAGLVLLATHVLTFNTPGSVAASTLVAAALFSPLRRRVQRMVDRRFNRTRYDAEQTVTAFAARLQDAVDLGSVRDDLASVVQRALEPAHISIWTGEGVRTPHEGLRT